MKCPNCGSKRIKRSQSRGFKERLQKLFNQKAYRCIDCDWRGILKTKSSLTKRDINKYFFIKIAIIIIIIITIYIIISILNKEAPEPPQQDAVEYRELSKTFIA
jgi:DNA-directed RNA polymerase subunit RPC12/RpoP